GGCEIAASVLGSERGGVVAPLAEMNTGTSVPNPNQMFVGITDPATTPAPWLAVRNRVLSASAIGTMSSAAVAAAAIASRPRSSSAAIITGAMAGTAACSVP